jgi:hypothetical protein
MAAEWVPYAGPVTRESLRQFLRWMVRTKMVRKRKHYAHAAVNAVTAAARCGTLTDGRIIVKLDDAGKAVAADVGKVIDCAVASGWGSDVWERRMAGWWRDNARVKADRLGEPIWQCTDPGEDGKTWYCLPPLDGTRFAVVEARYYDLMLRLHPGAGARLERPRDNFLRPVHFYNAAGVMVGSLMPIERAGPATAA